MRSKQFTDKWLKAFGVKKFDEKFFSKKLEDLQFPDKRDFVLVKFLFKELPLILNERRSEYVWNLANAFGFFCLSFWQSKIAFVSFPENYATILKEALEKNKDIYSSKIRAIVELLADTSKDGICGFNSFVFKDKDTLKKASKTLYFGSFENYLSDIGRAKFDEFEKKIFNSSEFKKDWKLIKDLYPKQTSVKGKKLRRKLLLERGWTQTQGADFSNEESEFESIFELFCWKYYLWAMDGDKPYLMKPSVNITPLGTQIFIPSYMSYDAKRDFNHGEISKLHKAKGVQKQGLAFSETRIKNVELSKCANIAEIEGRALGLKGEKLLEFIAESIGRPNMDLRTIRKLIRK